MKLRSGTTGKITPVTSETVNGAGAARLLYVGHATVLLELDGVRLLTDPVLRRLIGHLRRRVSLDPSELTRLDAVLVSHLHYDHLDRPSLVRFAGDATIVVPRGARGLLRGFGFSDVREVEVGDEVQIGGLTVQASPAEHRSARMTVRSSPSLGYVVSGSRRVYFAGDTDLFDGMASLAGSLDLALLPVAGWGPKVGPGHLDPLRAAKALRLLQPRLAVPIHWGTLSLIGRPTSNEPPEAFRRHAAELAPDVDVRILEPGSALTF
jgi:L-ascorbate metabolism protein UlaG (beta-lactamase superfamily)